MNDSGYCYWALQNLLAMAGFVRVESGYRIVVVPRMDLDFPRNSFITIPLNYSIARFSTY
jgi:hypothetical protein